MKVSLYIRQRGTRQFQKHNPKKSYAQNGNIIWVLRYGSTWETLDAKTLSEATALRLRRQIELDGGWRPTTKVEEPTVLMLDKAKDVYLAQIEKGRKPKTFDAYNTSLRYLYECIGNKPMKDIDRGDLLNFAGALIAAKVEARKSAKKDPAFEAMDAANAEQITVPDQEQKYDFSEDEVVATFANGGK